MQVWSTRGVDGVYRFLGRSWRLFEASLGDSEKLDAEPTKEQLKVLHQMIKKVRLAVLTPMWCTCSLSLSLSFFYAVCTRLLSKSVNVG